jgi:hypothetical protein
MNKNIKDLEKVENKKQIWIFTPGHSLLRNNVFSKEVCKYLFNELEKEIVYIPRGELKFRICSKLIPLPRVKAF